MRKWNTLVPDIHDCVSHNVCKARLNFIRPGLKKMYSIHGQVGLTKLTLVFSYLRKHKFQHNVNNIAFAALKPKLPLLSFELLVVLINPGNLFE